jgi:alkanesulfonate monooxygenase SsuD/methylene tetrahydromethanopterin reductase-like flavin-dependent oxidoreductase (luciferase family)
METIEFGWTMPIGGQRQPATRVPYGSHVGHILAHLSSRFQSAWIPDHFMDADHNDFPEALITVSHMTALYPALSFGTVVLGQSYRNPALLAKMAATLQQLSGGRFVMGIGAGWKEDEYRAYGYPFPKASVRIAQLAEVVQICRAMWDPNQETATFRGQYYQIEGAVCNPKPVPPPPVMIGGGGEKLTLRVVAQYADWWNLVGNPPESYAHKISVLERHCADVGRDPAEIRKTWMGVVSLAKERRQAQAALDGYPIWPDDVALTGTPSDVVTQLRQYTRLGVDLFILAFVGEPDLTGVNLFLNEVLPEFQG